MVALVIAVIVSFIAMRFDIDSDFGFFITLSCLWMATFYYSGRRFLKPIGEKKVDLSVFYPGCILFVIFNLCFINTVKNKYGSFKVYIAKMGLEDMILVIFIIVSASLFVSFFLWLGMMGNKKKYEESDEWNPNE